MGNHTSQPEPVVDSEIAEWKALEREMAYYCSYCMLTNTEPRCLPLETNLVLLTNTTFLTKLDSQSLSQRVDGIISSVVPHVVESIAFELTSYEHFDDYFTSIDL